LFGRGELACSGVAIVTAARLLRVVAIGFVPAAFVLLVAPAASERTDEARPPSASVVVAVSYSAGRAHVGWLDIGALGGELRPLAPRPALSSGTSDTAPSWSPDGNQIAFVRHVPGAYSLYKTSADGSNATQLASLGRSVAEPDIAWSAEGPSVVFDRFRGVECRVKKPFRLRYTIASSTGALRDIDALARPHRLTVLLGGHWSPDLLHLTYSMLQWPAHSSEPCGGHAGYYDHLLYVERADGTRRKLLARGDVVWDWAWSPDGKRLAYSVSNASGLGCDFSVVNADGKGRRRLLRNVDCDASIDWFPDESAILLTYPGELDRIDLETKHLRKIFRWSSSYGSWSLGPSPDGQWLAIVEDYGLNESDRTTSMRIALVQLAEGSATTYDVRPDGPGETLDEIQLRFSG